MFTSSIKRETRKFHVVVVQCSSVMLVQSCCFANLTLFCRSRCRRRRRCLSSLIASHRQTKQNRRLWAQFVVVGSLPRSERFLFPGTPVFPSLQNPTFSISNSTRNQVDENHLVDLLPLNLSLVPRGFFPGYSGFPLSSKPNIFNFQFDQESGRREPLSGFATSKALLIYCFIYKTNDQ